MRTFRHLLRWHSARTPHATRARLMRPAVDLVASGALDSAVQQIRDAPSLPPSGSMLAVRMARTIRDHPDDFARWYDKHRDDAGVRPDARDALYHRPARKRRKTMSTEETRYHVRTFWPFYLTMIAVVIALVLGFSWAHVSAGP